MRYLSLFIINTCKKVKLFFCNIINTFNTGMKCITAWSCLSQAFISRFFSSQKDSFTKIWLFFNLKIRLFLHIVPLCTAYLTLCWIFGHKMRYWEPERHISKYFVFFKGIGFRFSIPFSIRGFQNTKLSASFISLLCFLSYILRVKINQ